MNEQSDRSSLVAEDHDGVRRRLYTMPIETRVFAVISWGCAATRWLAKALNSHPEILCIHNANQLWRRWTGGEQADEWTYLRFVAHLGRGYSAAGDVHGVVRSEVPRLRETLGPLFNAGGCSRTVGASPVPDGFV